MESGQILKQALLSVMVSLLAFLMINVAFAQVMADTLLTAADAGSALTVIVFLGFIIAVLVSLIVTFIIAEGSDRIRTLYVSFFALLANFIIWAVIAYLCVINRYPDIIPDPDTGSLFTDILMRGVQYLFSIPRIMAYFAIYILNNITHFWIYTLAGFSLCNAFFLHAITRRK